MTQFMKIKERMFQVTKAEVQGLFKEVRDSFRSDDQSEFAEVYDEISALERSEFDAISGLWLSLEFMILPYISNSSQDESSVARFGDNRNLVSAAIVNEAIWDELVALQIDFVSKKYHRSKMIIANLKALHTIIENNLKKAKESADTFYRFFIALLCAVPIVFGVILVATIGEKLSDSCI